MQVVTLAKSHGRQRNLKNRFESKLKSLVQWVKKETNQWSAKLTRMNKIAQKSDSESKDMKKALNQPDKDEQNQLISLAQKAKTERTTQSTWPRWMNPAQKSSSGRQKWREPLDQPDKMNKTSTEVWLRKQRHGRTTQPTWQGWTKLHDRLV